MTVWSEAYSFKTNILLIHPEAIYPSHNSSLQAEPLIELERRMNELIAEAERLEVKALELQKLHLIPNVPTYIWEDHNGK